MIGLRAPQEQHPQLVAVLYGIRRDTLIKVGKFLAVAADLGTHLYCVWEAFNAVNAHAETTTTAGPAATPGGNGNAATAATVYLTGKALYKRKLICDKENVFSSRFTGCAQSFSYGKLSTRKVLRRGEKLLTYNPSNFKNNHIPK